MKIAIVGSRKLCIDDIGKYLPQGVTEIVSGGAKGIDACAREYALKKGIKLTEFIPQYEKYGRAAPLKRDLQIIEYSDAVIAFWDGVSAGTKYVINSCKKKNIDITIYVLGGKKEISP